MADRVPGVWFVRKPVERYTGAVVIRRDHVPRITPETLAARIRDYGITPGQCEPAREVGDKIMILVRGPVPSTNAEVQDLYTAKVAGHVS